MKETILILCMFFCHIADDYYLQGWLASAKQKKWWRFDTKEEGFIELALEILKFNRMGAYTIEEIGAIHAPVEDNNENWIPNVTDAYTMVSADTELLEILQSSPEKGFTR